MNQAPAAPVVELVSAQRLHDVVVDVRDFPPPLPMRRARRICPSVALARPRFARVAIGRRPEPQVDGVGQRNTFAAGQLADVNAYLPSCLNDGAHTQRASRLPTAIELG